MSADSLARVLEARRSGASWMAKCPAHDDRNPSLSITEVDGKILLVCCIAIAVDVPTPTGVEENERR